VPKDPALSASPLRPPRFEEVYREQADFVWRLLRHFAVAEASRDDVFHEVFLVVLRRLPDYDGRASLRSWLFGITRNVVLHHRRGHARHQRKLAVVPAPTPGPGPEEHVAQVEVRRLVQRFLDGLTEEHRLAFVLAEIEGLRAPEIADQLGVNLSTLYSRLQVLRRQFARFVAECRAPGGHHGSP
jgi:RNA polymerase sigma-70 factor (ECF subfamily)